MVEYVDKQGIVFCVQINNIDYKLIKVELYQDGMIPIRRVMRGSTMGWNLKGIFVSYFKIRDCILQK